MPAPSYTIRVPNNENKTLTIPLRYGNVAWVKPAMMEWKSTGAEDQSCVGQWPHRILNQMIDLVVVFENENEDEDDHQDHQDHQDHDDDHSLQTRDRSGTNFQLETGENA